VCTFGRRHKDRGIAAREFAYNHKARIHEAFDKGRSKADILDELSALFSRSLYLNIETGLRVMKYVKGQSGNPAGKPKGALLDRSCYLKRS
jgi:hypothetical protein